MNNLSYIFNVNPLFKHCNERERDFLAAQGRVSFVKSGQVIDLKKISAFNTILEGVFELEVFGKNEFIYLTPGSYFGDFPFTEIKNRGLIRAVSDGRLLNFNTDDLYKFFFMNYKALRGYVRALNGLGMEISRAGQALFSKKSKIITVFSSGEGSGNSLFSSSLALSLSDAGKSILLDMSYGGNSVFNYFGRKITPPLSQKQVESAATDELISDRLEKISDGLDLLNVLHGAKVKASPSIISPLLLALSKNYTYIIVDLSNTDEEFRDRVFDQSDYILNIVKGTRDRESLYDMLDDGLTGGQRVYYVLNPYYRESDAFEGGYTWDKLDLNKNQKPDEFSEILKKSVPGGIVERITASQTALIMQTGRIDSFAYAGMYIELMKNGVHFDLHYATAFAFLPLALYLLGINADDYRDRVLNLFSRDKMNNLLDVTFPRESLFKNSKLVKMACEISQSTRAEFFNMQPLLLAARSDGTTRLFSTGRLADLIVASLTAYPLFEPYKIGRESYVSGYPACNCGVEELNRMDIETMIQVSVKPSESRKTMTSLPFYANYLAYFDHIHGAGTYNITPSKRFEIELPDNEDDPEKLLGIASRITNKSLKENHLI